MCNLPGAGRGASSVTGDEYMKAVYNYDASDIKYAFYSFNIDLLVLTMVIESMPLLFSCGGLDLPL